MYHWFKTNIFLYMNSERHQLVTQSSWSRTLGTDEAQLFLAGQELIMGQGKQCIGFAFFCYFCTCVRHFDYRSDGYGHSYKPIAMKLGVNVLGSKSERRMCKAFLSPPISKWRPFCGPFCSYCQLPWPILIKYGFFKYLYKFYFILELCLTLHKLWKRIQCTAASSLEIRKQRYNHVFLSGFKTFTD